MKHQNADCVDSMPMTLEIVLYMLVAVVVVVVVVIVVVVVVIVAVSTTRFNSLTYGSMTISAIFKHYHQL